MSQGLLVTLNSTQLLNTTRTPLCPAVGTSSVKKAEGRATHVTRSDSSSCVRAARAALFTDCELASGRMHRRRAVSSLPAEELVLVLVLMCQIRSSVADFGVPEFSAEAASRWCVLCDPRVQSLPRSVLMRRSLRGLGSWSCAAGVWRHSGVAHGKHDQSVCSQGLSQFCSFHPKVRRFPIPIVWGFCGDSLRPGPCDLSGS